MRPMTNPRQNPQPQSEVGRAFWEAMRKKQDASYEEWKDKEVFNLSQKEAQRCRFEIVDQNHRMAECTVHRDNFSHGIKMFPPHLWDIKAGIAYHKVNGQWERWIPQIKENVQRLDKES